MATKVNTECFQNFEQLLFTEALFYLMLAPMYKSSDAIWMHQREAIAPPFSEI
jgi:hypothetical protein